MLGIGDTDIIHDHGDEIFRYGLPWTIWFMADFMQGVISMPVWYMAGEYILDIVFMWGLGE